MAYGTIGNKETITKIRPINTKFVYDGNSDQPTACFVGEQQMLFVRNLQGDILAVAKSDGEVVAEFSYDAWGNVEYTVPDGVDETFATFIPLFCPLTYRGYNYDFTTGLYYLQSRYYNPEWGRFMNVDDTSILLATQGTSHGANLFAYCANNPVNQVDYSGEKYTPIDLTNLGHVLILIFYVQFYDKINIGSDYTSNKDSLYYNSKKGYIQIDVESEKYFDGNSINLSNLVYQFYEIKGDLAFDILAVIATNKFYNEFKNKHNSIYSSDKTEQRNFLFSDECVSNEIKHHLLLKWNLEDKTKKTSGRLVLGQTLRTAKSTIKTLRETGDLQALNPKVFGENWSTSAANSCKQIDIYEQDAAKFEDRTAFGYFSGIREEYKYTTADPYWQGWKIRTYQNAREEWKKEKIQIN